MAASAETIPLKELAPLNLLRDLRRPFPAEAVKFKVQTNPKPKQGGGFTNALMVAYIDARQVTARLNHVVGLDWCDAYRPVDGGMGCILTVYGVSRHDVGWSRGIGTDIDLKALYSDAFKRAAVKWGIGEFLYATPKMYLAPDLLAHRKTPKGDQWYMTDKATAECRKRFRAWLEAEGTSEFGEPLGHGDSEDHQGDVEAGDAGEPEAPAPVVAAGEVVELRPGEDAQADPLLAGRSKAAWMLAAAVNLKADLNAATEQARISEATSYDRLGELYELYCEAVREHGGDPEKVAEAWANR